MYNNENFEKEKKSREIKTVLLFTMFNNSFNIDYGIVIDQGSTIYFIINNVGPKNKSFIFGIVKVQSHCVFQTGQQRPHGMGPQINLPQFIPGTVNCQRLMVVFAFTTKSI